MKLNLENEKKKNKTKRRQAKKSRNQKLTSHTRKQWQLLHKKIGMDVDLFAFLVLFSYCKCMCL